MAERRALTDVDREAYAYHESCEIISISLQVQVEALPGSRLFQRIAVKAQTVLASRAQAASCCIGVMHISYMRCWAL
jgi:hypothetical protein